MFFRLLRRIVVDGAKALQLTEPKLIRVALVLFDMVGDRGRGHLALQPAHAT